MYDRTTYFDLYYDAIDEPLIKDLRQTVDTDFERILSDFDLPVPGERYFFFLCRDVAEYIARTGKTAEEYEEWMVGWADYHSRKLCILSPRVVADRTPEEMRKVVIHEIVHIALDSLQAADRTGIFLSEGIAVAYAGQIAPEALDLENYPSILEIWSEDDFYDNGGYDYSGVYIRYFLKKYGTERFKKIYAGEDGLFQWIGEGFERDAIEDCLNGEKCPPDGQNQKFENCI